MKILIYKLPFLNIDGVKIGDFEKLYEEIDKNYDVLILNFSDISEFVEIKKYFKGFVVFLCNFIDEISYKKALEIGDYCYSFDEIFKIKYRLEYIAKKLKKSNFFKYRNLFFDIKNERLFKERKEVRLTKGELEILKILIHNKSRYINKYQILDESEYIENENSIKVLISRLRKLGFNIKSIKNQGYKIKEEK